MIHVTKSLKSFQESKAELPQCHLQGLPCSILEMGVMSLLSQNDVISAFAGVGACGG